MLIYNKSEVDTSARKRGNKRRLIKTISGPIVLINLPTIGDFSRSRTRNQALTYCFQGFAWLKAVG